MNNLFKLIASYMVANGCNDCDYGGGWNYSFSELSDVFALPESFFDINQDKILDALYEFSAISGVVEVYDDSYNLTFYGNYCGGFEE